MYPRKFHGDRLDPSKDFKGAVGNRSNLSVCTIPSLHPKFDEFGKTQFKNDENTKHQLQQFRDYKRKQEQVPRILSSQNAQKAAANQATPLSNNIPIILPKKRNTDKKSILSKFSKRLSSISNILEESFDFKDSKANNPNENMIPTSLPKNAPVSSPNDTTKISFTSPEQITFNDDSYIDMNPKSKTIILQEKRCVSMPNKYKKLPPIPPITYSMTSETKESRLFQDTQPEYQKPQTSGTELFQSKQLPSFSSKKVVLENNQLYVNFHESKDSLVTDLLNTYMTLEQEHSINLQPTANPKKLDSSNNVAMFSQQELLNFESPSSVKNRFSTYTGESSTYASTGVKSDLFSIVPSACSSSDSNVSEYANNLEQFPQVQLATKSYNKKLPITPSIKRHFNDDIFASPQISATSNSSTEYYDCLDFDDKINCSPLAIKKVRNVSAPHTSLETVIKNVKDMSIQPKSVHEQKARAVSQNYLQNVGIQLEMLKGYQS